MSKFTIIDKNGKEIFSHEGHCVTFNDTLHLYPEGEYEIQKWCKIYKLKDGESVVRSTDDSTK